MQKKKRNYKRERELSKEKYSRVLGDINKELGEALKLKLKSEKKSIATWITENAEKYLEKK